MQVLALDWNHLYRNIYKCVASGHERERERALSQPTTTTHPIHMPAIGHGKISNQECATMKMVVFRARWEQHKQRQYLA
jgi:hypothetical protein